MEYRKLGKSDLNVSRICLGCMGFGDAASGMHSWTLDEEHSRKIIKHALDKGINFFDTALGYQGGSSERFVGKAIRDFAKRDEVVVATKFMPRSPEEISNDISMREHILKSLDTSLGNLQMEYIDLYIYHMWDNNSQVEEVMETLDEIVKSGKARYIGISNCFAWQLARANYIAEKNGWSKFISIQGHYNLLFREEEREMVPFCREEGIALTPYSPLASGRLVKASGETSKRLEEDSFAKGKYDATAEQDRIIVERVAELAEKKGMTKTQIALGWLLSKADAPLVGATKEKYIDDAVDAVTVKLCEDEIRYLEEPYIPHKLTGVMERYN